MEQSIAWWDWIGIVSGALAVLALMMATPTLFQMAWGRPKVTLEFGVTSIGTSIVLECNIENKRVHKVLRKVGVRREMAQDVWGMFEIKEKGSGVIKSPSAFAMFVGRDGEVGSAHVSVHSGTIGRRFGVVAQSPEDKTVLVMGRER